MSKFLLKYLRLIILAVTIFLASFSQAQIFSGKITNRNGEGIPFATIYIYELKSGISADLKGDYVSKLSPGRYTMEASSLGYQREKFVIELGTTNLFRTIVLDEMAYELDEAFFSGKSDDRGSAIMKRAIALAPHFKYLVREYEADNYLKGTIRITKIPALLKLRSRKEMMNLVIGKLFILESFSTIKYNFPDKYDQTVKAFSSTIPNEISPGDFSTLMKSSIYDSEIFGLVSPLSPKALSYYRFVYQGISNESGRVVNKILVVPKRGNSKLFAGHLYIVDNIWSVSYAELVAEQSGVKTNIKVNYNEVSDGVHLPTTYNVDVKIDVMGVKGEGRYYSSLTYKNIKKNEASSAFAVKKIPPAEVQFTKKEAKKVAKIFEKELAPPPAADTTLELKRTSVNTKVIVDSLAGRKDSLYWLEVRKVPLRGDELISYKKSDSIKIEFREIEKRDSVKNQNRGRGDSPLERIFFGHKYKIGKELYFSYGGLSKVVGSFNFVDGYQLGQPISLEYLRWKDAPLTFDGSLYYSFPRKALLWSVKANLKHSPMKNGSATISAGRESADISNNPGVSGFINSYSSWLFAINPVKLVEKKYVKLFSSIDIANGLQSSVSLSYNLYSPLSNGNTLSLFGRRGEENIPQNIFDGMPTFTSSMIFSASLRYTPRYHYRIDKGYKRYVRSAYPTFLFGFSAAIKAAGAESSWSRVDAGLRQKIKTDIYSSLSYSFNAGVFLSSSSISLPDYKHFAASNIIFSDESFNERYLMLDGYFLSTSHSWVDLKVNYSTEYLLLKYLTFLDTPLLTESIHFKSLWLPSNGIHHSEVGYSFGMDDLGRVGIFVSFDGFKYKGVSVRVSIPLINSIR